MVRVHPTVPFKSITRSNVALPLPAAPCASDARWPWSDMAGNAGLSRPTMLRRSHTLLCSAPGTAKYALMLFVPLLFFSRSRLLRVTIDFHGPAKLRGLFGGDRNHGNRFSSSPPVLEKPDDFAAMRWGHAVKLHKAGQFRPGTENGTER